MSSKKVSKDRLAQCLSTVGGSCDDARLFGYVAETVAGIIEKPERSQLYSLLLDFRQWDSTVNMHEERQPLQRPLMIGSFQHANRSEGIFHLRRWCVDRCLRAKDLSRMRWWLETVVVFFEIRSRWGPR